MKHSPEVLKKRLNGQYQARTLFPLGPCVYCGGKARERHHKDDNPQNNDPSNVVSVCRKCHMQQDGRLAALGASHLSHKIKAPEPCSNCGKHAKPLRRTLCPACAQYQRTHCTARPAIIPRRIHPPKACVECGILAKPVRRGMCMSCYNRDYARRSKADAACYQRMLARQMHRVRGG